MKTLAAAALTALFFAPTATADPDPANPSGLYDDIAINTFYGHNGLSAIPVAAFIYVGESERFTRLRLKLSGRKEYSRPGLDHASVTKPNSAAEASIGLFGSTRTV